MKIAELRTFVVGNPTTSGSLSTSRARTDLGLALALGDEAGVPLDLAALVRQRFAEARDRYGGTAWSPTVVKLLEDEVGEELRAPGYPASLS